MVGTGSRRRGRAGGVNGWLEQARQRATDWAADGVAWLVAAGNVVGTDGLILAGLLVCLVVAVLVRRGAHRAVRSSVPTVPDAPTPEVVARDDGAVRAAATVAALMAVPGQPARVVRMEEQGGHLTRMVLTLVGSGPSAESALAALGRGETTPALGVLASQARAKAEAGDASVASAFRDLAALALVDDPAAAVAAARRATVLAPERSEVWSLLALAAAEAGDLREARAAGETVLKLGAGTGDQGLVAGALGILGEVHLAEGALDRAEEYFRIALTYQAGLSRPGSAVRHYQKLCQLHQMRGDLAGAAELLSRALALETQFGRREGLAELESQAGALAHRRGRLPDACRHWARARQLYQEMGRADSAAEIDGLIAAALRAPMTTTGER